MTKRADMRGVPMTDRQEQILGFIAGYARNRGYPPTTREIGQRFRIASTNAVHELLVRIRRRGFLTWEDGKVRTLRVVPRADAALAAKENSKKFAPRAYAQEEP